MVNLDEPLIFTSPKPSRRREIIQTYNLSHIPSVKILDTSDPAKNTGHFRPKTEVSSGEIRSRSEVSQSHTIMGQLLTRLWTV